MLSDLTRSLNELREEVRAIRNTGSNESVDAGVLPLDLPLHNIEELNNAEAALQSQEANKAMVRHFALIGGTTLEVQVRRVMAYAITNELASVLNWAGKKTKDQTKQKRAFKDTALCRCIFDGLTQQLGANSVRVCLCTGSAEMAPIRPRPFGWRRMHIIHPHPGVKTTKPCSGSGAGPETGHAVGNGVETVLGVDRVDGNGVETILEADRAGGNGGEANEGSLEAGHAGGSGGDAQSSARKGAVHDGKDVQSLAWKAAGPDEQDGQDEQDEQETLKLKRRLDQARTKP
ncbi:uncharacterized protein LOC120443539 [Oreochromis aureus]|uniref:uncharacterized protein LOC120443539 n=1 Tax=Oreochromis aureus TaxID=47969 RepID=UPI001952AD50|nr:uncharacterized protein LOC120443539 [Oreochromis aureus]